VVCDRGVIERARNGEREALGELWRAYQPALLRYLRSRRTTSPDDVASQVWADVASSLTRFEGDADDFRRWLFTIAHRRSVDSIRRAVRDDRVAIRAADEIEIASADVVAGADEEFDRSESLDRALALIARMPDQMGAAVMLRVVNEMPIADVAEILRTSEGNVRVLVHRGMERLRRKLCVTDDSSPTMNIVP
jgi:RNA polymerase sigma-70 factor (ECF subfamily)